MSIVTPYIKNLERIEKQLPQVAKDAVEDNAEFIINLVKFEQLAKGKNSFGNPLVWDKGSGFYAVTTQGFADRQGITISKTARQPYNFQWTSDTFDSMGIKLKAENGYEILTIDGKQSLLESIYGEVFRLTPKHNTLVNETIIQPSLGNYILDNLFVF